MRNRFVVYGKANNWSTQVSGRDRVVLQCLGALPRGRTLQTACLQAQQPLRRFCKGGAHNRVVACPAWHAPPQHPSSVPLDWRLYAQLLRPTARSLPTPRWAPTPQDPSSVPPEWHSWLHYIGDYNPTNVSLVAGCGGWPMVGP